MTPEMLYNSLNEYLNGCLCLSLICVFFLLGFIINNLETIGCYLHNSMALLPGFFTYLWMFFKAILALEKEVLGACIMNPISSRRTIKRTHSKFLIFNHMI